MRKADTTEARSNAGHARRKFCKVDFLNMYASWLVSCPGEKSFSGEGRSQKLSEYVSPHWRCQEINGIRGRSSRAPSAMARRTEIGKAGGVHSGGTGIASALDRRLR